MSNVLNNLVNKAREAVKDYELPPSEFRVENLTAKDKEKLLWYLVEEYQKIAEDYILWNMVIQAAEKDMLRATMLNEFLMKFFGDVLRAIDAKEALNIAFISEKDTEQMLEYVLDKYTEPWEDETFLRGVALLSRIVPEGGEY